MPRFFAAGLLAVQEIAAAGLTAPRPWLPAPRHLGPCLVGWPMGPFLQGRGEVRFAKKKGLWNLDPRINIS